jgi:lipopolysaccharide export system protein LptC
MQLGTKSAILFPLALLLLLALLTFWIDKSVQQLAPKLDGSSRHDPDYIMSNFETTKTDVNGALRYKLAASEMRHFPDVDSTDLIKPRFTQFAKDKPYTKLQGDTGNVSSDGEQVEVFGNVLVLREAFGDKGEMTVETDYLKILPNEEYATTDRPVVIKQAPGTVVYATGLIYEKQQQTVTLLHKVRAHYERPAAKAKKVMATDKKNNRQHSVAGKPAVTVQPDKTDNSARIRRRYE